MRIPFDGKTPTISRSAFVADGARLIGDVTLKDGASVWYNAVVRGDEAGIVIGENTNIQDNCVLHCNPGEPMSIGRHVTIGHGAILHGRRIGGGTLIGMGAILLAGSEVGSGCVVAAGSVVRENTVFPDGCLAAGNPAQVKRFLTTEERKYYADISKEYVALAMKMKKTADVTE